MGGSAGIHVLLFGVAAILTAGVSLWSYRNRDKQAASSFFVFAVVVTVWNTTTVVEILSTHDALLVALYFLNRACIVSMVLVWFYFAVSYTGYTHTFRPQSIAIAVGALGAVLILVSAAPPFTSLTYGEIAVFEGDFRVAYHTENTATTEFVRFVGLGFAGVASLMLIYRLIETGYARTWQALSVLGVTMAAIFYEYFQPTVLGPVEAVDYSPLTVSLVVVVYVVALYRYDLFSYRPVATEDIIESVADPVIAINPDDNVVKMNAAASALFADDVTLGSEAAAVLPEQVHEAYDLETSRQEYEQITLTTNGETRWYDVHTAPLREVSGEQGVAMSLRDITALEQQTQELERQTEQLDNFASVLSHDLRNPLQIAKLYAEMLEEELGATDAERATDTQVEQIQDALDRMDEMIEHVLTLAREGKTIEERVSVALRPLVTSAWEMADTHDASLENEIPEEFDVMADPGRLQTVFENLFRNSVEHGPKDVTVRVGVCDGRDAFYVEDDGPGIPEEDRENVFEYGFSSDSDGTGFGLAIVESITQAHGWRVEATESARSGARFEFEMNNGGR